MNLPSTLLLLFNQINVDEDIESQLIFSLGYCFFLLVLAIVFSLFLPKKPNAIYGYRTANSMKSQEAWDAANSYWVSIFLKITVINFLFPAIAYFFFDTYLTLITVIATTITLLLTIPFTEIFLKKNFDKNGNRI
ncbi:hypothetical protein SCB49_05115 [unidentified eubacterium SCB49]|nr:hypothetical protein SCB49_05115 [unidentified eubacterium SCB49]